MSLNQGKTVQELGEDLTSQAVERSSRGASSKCKFIERQRQRENRHAGLGGQGFPCKGSRSVFQGKVSWLKLTWGIVTGGR